MGWKWLWSWFLPGRGSNPVRVIMYTRCGCHLCDEAWELLHFFFQAEDGIRDADVTGVQTRALPICRGGRRHRLGHRERADALGALAARRVGRLDDRARRGAARAHDDAGARVDDVALLESGVTDRLVHGDVVPGGAAAVEAHCAAVDRPCRVERGRAVHLAAEAELGVLVGARDPGLRFAQAREHFLC